MDLENRDTPSNNLLLRSTNYHAQKFSLALYEYNGLFLDSKHSVDLLCAQLPEINKGLK